MIRRFLRDKRGNFAMLTAIAIVPIMGALALAVDYAEMSRQRQDTMNALDAAGIATARRIVDGKTKPEMTDAELEAEIKTYAKDFFEANLGSVSPENATLTVVLPQNNSGGGTLKLSATLDYEPYFFPVFTKLLGTAEKDGTTELNFDASAEIRLKNTLEVALVLDNSGSMDELGSGTGQKRIDLLKAAANPTEKKSLIPSSMSARATQTANVLPGIGRHHSIHTRRASMRAGKDASRLVPRPTTTMMRRRPPAHRRRCSCPCSRRTKPAISGAT
jgi:Flp pilus assembly protein TadG